MFCSVINSNVSLLNEMKYLLLPGFRFPDKIGGNLSGVHYVRDVADANSLISSLVFYTWSAYFLINFMFFFSFSCKTLNLLEHLWSSLAS